MVKHMSVNNQPPPVMLTEGIFVQGSRLMGVAQNLHTSCVSQQNLGPPPQTCVLPRPSLGVSALGSDHVPLSCSGCCVAGTLGSCRPTGMSGVENPAQPERLMFKEGSPARPHGVTATCCTMVAPCPYGLLPSLGVDDDGPRLVSVPAEHHAHGVPVQPVDVDGVGGLARPEQRPAVDVDAEVVRLSVCALAGARGGQEGGL